MKYKITPRDETKSHNHRDRAPQKFPILQLSEHNRHALASIKAKLSFKKG